MLYQYPPENDPWSLLSLGMTLFFLGFAVSIPVSLWACLRYGRTRRWIWIAGEIYWGVLALFFILMSPNFWHSVGRWIPFHSFAWPSVKILFVCVLIFIPFPAFVLGLYRLSLPTPLPANVRIVSESTKIWIGSTAFSLFCEVFLFGPSGRVPEATYRSICKDHLKQIGLAMDNYYWDKSRQFPDLIFPGDGSAQHSWRVELLPYVDQSAAAKRYDRRATWDAPQNLAVAQNMDFYVCPSIPKEWNHDSLGRKYTAYATLIGAQTVFPQSRGISLEKMVDGSSNTVLVVEACGQSIVWTEPRDIPLMEQIVGFNLPGSRRGHSPAVWSSFHRGGAYTLFADGRVQFLSSATDPKVLHAITTATGGEEVGEY